MPPRFTRREWLQGLGIGLGAAVISGQATRLMAQSDPGPRMPDIRHPEGKHINLAGNENPFGPSPAASLAIMQGVPGSVRYPWREEVVLGEVIASYERVKPENIVLTNGCDELLAIGGALAADMGGNIVSSTPTYDWLGEYGHKSGADVHWVMHNKDTMQHDLEGFKKAIDSKTALVYICNPDTPSGTMHPKAVIRDFILSLDPKIIVFLDEVYLDLLDAFDQLTLTELVHSGRKIIIGRSFSKLYALAGHRVGYAITTPELAKQISNYKMSSMNYLGVAAAKASLYDHRFRAMSRQKIRAGREKFCALLDDLGIQYTPSIGNFVFHKTGIPIREYQEMTKAAGYIVGRPFEPYAEWCRISIGNEKEMDGFAKFMKDTFSSCNRRVSFSNSTIFPTP
ncbi:MAG: pyridoxal phosphate-dependent aminotransferase [Opitutales bacterium]